MKFFVTKVLLLGCFLFPQQGFCQLQDLFITRNLTRVDVPFEYNNHFIIIKIIFNDVFPLKFILDTGAEHTILTKREISDLMQVNYQRRFPVLGADMKTELFAYLATGVRLKINNMYFTNQPILVLEDDYFKFEEAAGMDIHGILGADILRRFVIKIDYERRIISFFNPVDFKPPGGKYELLRTVFKRNKPYVFSTLLLDNDKTVDAKLLMDSGASLSLLLHTNTNPNITVPPNVVRTNIGMGLGGTLEGFVGRIPGFKLTDNLKLDAVITNYQDIETIRDTAYLHGRHGILGNQALSRFMVIVDYPREKVYVQPNKRYKQKFKYDRSGLSLVSSGVNLTVFNVTFVMEGSPAAEAGLQRGDELRSINGIPSSVLNLQDVLIKLQKKPGKQIKMVVRRNGQRLKFHFKLRDLI